MKKMYCISDYFTDEIIDVTTDYNKAVKICDGYDGAIITIDGSDEILYDNVSLPF